VAVARGQFGNVRRWKGLLEDLWREQTEKTESVRSELLG
jgi:hypothetical protein